MCEIIVGGNKYFESQVDLHKVRKSKHVRLCPVAWSLGKQYIKCSKVEQLLFMVMEALAKKSSIITVYI